MDPHTAYPRSLYLRPWPLEQSIDRVGDIIDCRQTTLGMTARSRSAHAG
jgi:hypothetical protein